MLGVSNVNVDARSCQLTRITNLSTHLCVERRAVKDNLNLRASSGGLNLLSVLNKSNNTNARELVVVIAVKDGLIKAVRKCNPNALSIAPSIAVSRRTSALALLSHCSVKGVHVNNVTCICSNLTSKINRKSVGIVQKEGNLTRKLCAILKLLKLCSELGLTCVERSAKALLFCGQNAVDKSALLDKLWILCAKQKSNLVSILCHEGALDAQQAAMVDSAAEKATENVASALITRENAVANHKGNRTGMVCKNSQAAINLISGVVLLTRKLLAQRDEGTHDVTLVVGTLMLHDSCDTLKAHAGINVAVRKLRQRSIFLAVELSEDKVPELKVSVAVVARSFSLELRSLVKVNLRARTAGTSWTCCPEVVLFTQTGDVVLCYAKRLPNLNCLIVVSEDREVQAIKWQTKVLWRRDKLHCPGTCIALGVTTKGEVAQHLKE